MAINYSFSDSMKNLASPFTNLFKKPAVPATSTAPIGPTALFSAPKAGSFQVPTNPTPTPTPTSSGVFLGPIKPAVQGPTAPTPFSKQPIPQVKATTAPTPTATPIVPPAATGAQAPAPTAPAPTTGATAGASTTPPPAPAIPIVSPETQKAVDSANKAYEESLKVSPEELSTQEDIDKLVESTKTAYRNTSGQAIPLEFITGQLKSIEERATGLAEPLQRKLARLQAARTSSLEASKFALERAEKKMTEEKKVGEPQTVAPGTSVVKFNPTTGKYESMYTAPKEAVKPASAQEYEYAVSQGYKGTFNQYQNEDANRKARAGGAGTATDDAAVASWVGLIKGGQAKITSVPATLKNAVAQAMGETAASSSGRNLVDDAISAITTLESTGGKSHAIGANILGGFGKNIAGSESAGYLAQLDRVKSLLTLPNLQYMKGLGAMSDREFNTIASSVAALNPNMSEQQFDTELARIKGVMTETANKLKANATAGAGATEPPAQMKLPDGTVVTRQADGTYK